MYVLYFWDLHLWFFMVENMESFVVNLLYVGKTETSLREIWFCFDRLGRKFKGRVVGLVREQKRGYLCSCVVI